MAAFPRSSLRRVAAVALAAGALLASRSEAQPATFLVGGDICDFAAIQPAIDAAAAHPGPDVIRIAMNATYTAQALRINAQDLEIVGGFANCASPAPTPGARTTISGTGGAADSVLVILGTGSRTLRNLVIRGGDETDDGFGGGIDFQGSGVLVLQSVRVIQNRAGFGGGISFIGVGPSATLNLASDVTVDSNVAAGSGGGIRVSGEGRLHMLGPNTTVTANEARGVADDTGYGGGIQVVAPAEADIGSPGFDTVGVVAFNQAKYGGGIATTARADNNFRAITRLYSTDPQRPVRIHGNIASVAGGGYYGNVNVNSIAAPELTYLCAYEFRIDHNRAPDGAAIYLDHDDVLGAGRGAIAMFNRRDFPCDIGDIPGPVARRCDPGVPCNLIDSNAVQQANGQPADGAIVAMERSATLQAGRVAWVGNTGTDLIRARPEPDDDFIHVDVAECLMADNILTARLIATDRGRLTSCTLAGNTAGISSLLMTIEAEIRHAIIWQPGLVALAGDPETLIGSYIATNDPGSLPLGPTVDDREPRFIDPARGDYRLRAGSPLVDYAPPIPGDDRDLDGRPYDQDLPIVADEFGVRDIGAYERQALLPLELNGAFDVDLNHWTVVTAGITRFDPTENAAGSAGGGSQEVDWINDPVIVARVTGRVQCIHLPGPATYRLNSFARTSGSGPFAGQAAALHWEFRRDGTEACTSGAADREGDLNITGGPAWTQALIPAAIPVAPGEWTPNSSIAIYTVVKATGATPPPRLHAWFDGIELRVDLPVTAFIFANGFE